MGGLGGGVFRNQRFLGGHVGLQGSAWGQAGLPLGSRAWACERRRGPAAEGGWGEPRLGGFTPERAGPGLAAELLSGVAAVCAREEAAVRSWLKQVGAPP